ncbi:hypothetical protein [Salmonirosea aquatica]|uniref:Lipoprotein n=1 Tax=Salmonirosea aquatica TaxID=2654236 RepID=A0A7C9B9U6_9BACT|nr:hypothetical protein [Cytophagaceae bacterium SJW1-29]
MKSFAKGTPIFFLVICLVGMSSCKKDETEPDPQLTQQLASSSVIAELKALGMTLIETGKPVQIAGIYEMKPVELTATNIPNDWDVGHVFDDSDRFQLTNQNESDQTIKMNYKIGTQTGSSTEGFVAGAGNKFTAYLVTNSQYETATTKSLEIFSGEWSSDGIKNTQHAFYVLEKNDPDDLLVDVGSIRVSKDNDGFSNKISALRVAAGDASESDSGSFFLKHLRKR